MVRESGTLNEYDRYNEYQPDCYDDTMDLQWETAVTAEGTTTEDWNQIHFNGSNIWRFNFHFSNRPKEYLADCYQGDFTEYWASPDSFKLVTQIASSEDASQITFEGPSPNEDTSGNNDNSEYNLALDILGGVGGTYTTLGSAIGKYLLANTGSPVSIQKENNNTKFTWNLDLNGNYYDLPRQTSGEAQSVQVSMKVENHYQSGEHSIKYIPEYTFNYRTLTESYGTCGCKDGENIYVAHRTVSPYVPIYATYDVA